MYDIQKAINRYILGNQIMLLKNLVEFMIQMGYMSGEDIVEEYGSFDAVPQNVTLEELGIGCLDREEVLNAIADAYDLDVDICPRAKTLGDIVQCVNEELDRINND